jgi:histidinol-phosphate aminotransferase
VATAHGQRAALPFAAYDPGLRAGPGSRMKRRMSLQPRPDVLAIDPYTPGVAKLPGASRVIKLSSNEGAFGPPPGALRAAAEAAGQFHRYPDGGAAGLRAAIGARFGLDPASIVCGAGSDDLIYLLCHIYGGAGTELIMTAHGFSIYQIAGRLAGCTIVQVAERDLTTDVDAILAAVTPATRLVFVANPNNPTGCQRNRAASCRPARPRASGARCCLR